jgi:hypothetical protein
MPTAAYSNYHDHSTLIFGVLHLTRMFRDNTGPEEKHDKLYIVKM